MRFKKVLTEPEYKGIVIEQLGDVDKIGLEVTWAETVEIRRPIITKIMADKIKEWPLRSIDKLVMQIYGT